MAAFQNLIIYYFLKLLFFNAMFTDLLFKYFYSLISLSLPACRESSSSFQFCSFSFHIFYSFVSTILTRFQLLSTRSDFLFPFQQCSDITLVFSEAIFFFPVNFSLEWCIVVNRKNDANEDDDQWRPKRMGAPTRRNAGPEAVRFGAEPGTAADNPGPGQIGSVYHEIHISSQANFGELKKMLTGPTGLHHDDQKLFFKDKERESKAFLDTAGVKDKSKIVVLEDPISAEKRYLEMRKSAKMDKAAKTISEISLEVDTLAGQVSAVETLISKGGKVAEKELVNLIEMLMNQLLKLDGIVADGDVKLQRKMQVRRVQKYVETLDMLRIKNSTNGHASSPNRHPNGSALSSVQQHCMDEYTKQREQPARHSASGAAPVIITTQWETFEGPPRANPPGFTWDLL